MTITLQEEIKKQIRAGHGLRFDADANAVFRAVGRKEAQAEEDEDRLGALDSAALKAGENAELSKALLDELKDPGELSETPTEAEQEAFDAYQAALKEQTNELASHEKVKRDREKRAQDIRAYHKTLGEQKILNSDPKKELLKELNRFIERNVGSSACGRCCDLIDAYLAKNPTATIVKIKNFETYAIVIADANGSVICRARVVVSKK